MSILHPPVDDPQSGELPCERWNPTQNVRTILLSVVSKLEGYLDSSSISGEFVKRAKHIKSCQRGCVSDVPEVEGQQGQRQGVWEHHQVNICNTFFLLFSLAKFSCHRVLLKRWQSTAIRSGGGFNCICRCQWMQLATIYCTVARSAHKNLPKNFSEKYLSILSPSYYQYILIYFPVLRSKFCFAGNKWLRLMQRLTETKLLYHSRWKSKSTIWCQFTKDQHVRCQSTKLVHNIISMSKGSLSLKNDGSIWALPK